MLYRTSVAKRAVVEKGCQLVTTALSKLFVLRLAMQRKFNKEAVVIFRLECKEAECSRLQKKALLLGDSKAYAVVKAYHGVVPGGVQGATHVNAGNVRQAGVRFKYEGLPQFFVNLGLPLLRSKLHGVGNCQSRLGVTFQANRFQKHGVGVCARTVRVDAVSRRINWLRRWLPGYQAE